MAEFYVTQERAMAPGIAGDWPQVIPKPDGRLVKVDGLDELLRDARDYIGCDRGDVLALTLYKRLSVALGEEA